MDIHKACKRTLESSDRRAVWASMEDLSAIRSPGLKVQASLLMGCVTSENLVWMGDL